LNEIYQQLLFTFSGLLFSKLTQIKTPVIDFRLSLRRTFFNDNISLILTIKTIKKNENKN